MENFKDLKVWGKAHDLTGDLPKDTRIPKRRNLRIDKSNASRVGIDWRQHRRRMRTEIRSRDESLYSNCTRLSQRTRISSVSREGPRLLERRRVPRFRSQSLGGPTNVGLVIPTLEGRSFS